VLGTPQKRQVFEAAPPPPPSVTEYQVAAKRCPECGEVSVGLAPAGMTGRAQYGPLVHARTALAVCANYLPVARAARLVAALTGVSVSAGFAAGVRGKATALLGPFMDRVRELLPATPVLYADETPARAAGKLRYVHVACTEFLTAMHTGDRTSEAVPRSQPSKYGSRPMSCTATCSRILIVTGARSDPVTALEGIRPMPRCRCESHDVPPARVVIAPSAAESDAVDSRGPASG